MNEIEISPYRETDQLAVIDLLNAVAADVPYSYAIDGREFDATVLAPLVTPTLYPARLEHDLQGILVARVGDQAAGFVHVCRGQVPEGDGDTLQRRGIVRFLAFTAGRVDIGLRLLAAAEAYARAAGLKTMVAWHHSAGYPFYHASVGLLSGRNYDSLSALIEGGYTLRERWLCYSMDLAQAVTEWLPGQRLRVAQTAGVEPNWEMAVYYPTAARACGRVRVVTLDRLSAQRGRPAVYLREAAVIEAEQKKGIGRWLVQRAINEFHSRGGGEMIAHVHHQQAIAQAVLPRVGFAESAFRGYTFEKAL